MIKNMLKALCIAASLGILSTGLSADDIKLPASLSRETTYQIKQLDNSKTSLKNWTIVNDDVTGKPKRAFGTPVNFADFGMPSEGNVEQIARRFFELYGNDFGISTSDIRLVAKNYANNRWHVKFKQYYNDMEVMFSDISVTIFKNGNIMSANTEFYNDIDVPAQPKISYQTAINRASDKSTKAKIKDVILSKPLLKVMPYVVNKSLAYKLVYEHQYQTNELNEQFTSYVDANSGEVLWRFGNLMHAAKEVKVSGIIKDKYADAAKESKYFPNQKIRVDGNIYYTDKDGKLALNTESTDATAYLDGKYVQVYNVNESISQDNFSLSGSNVEFSWSDENSTLFERNLYYHTNVVHQYFKTIDPNQNFCDFPIEVSLMSGTGSPNAMSGGEQIYFINIDNTSAELAGSGSVLYHEYGHSMNRFHYAASGSNVGMINTACNEALADITSCAILNDSQVGKSVFTSDRNRFIRDVNNDNKYPDDVESDPHYTGQILAGALWDFYKLTDMETLNRVSHFAKYETPDDANDGNSFAEWFLACIVADDDDGDLSNGTPHLQELVTAFDKHNIGISLISGKAFYHKPVGLYTNGNGSYDVNFSFATGTNYEFLKSLVQVEKAEVVWSHWGSQEFHTVDATINPDGTYSAKIPEQQNGSILKYHVNLTLSSSDDVIQYSSEESFEGGDLLFVGYKTFFEDDFESEKGWVIGEDEDDATQGIWEREIPQEVLFQRYQFQPGEDHSENGEYCLVTDKYGEDDMAFLYSYADGRTTVTSPRIDLSKAFRPVLEYYHWTMIANFSNSSHQVGSDFYVSNDDGLTWTKIDELNKDMMSWSKRYVDIKKYISDFTNQMRFKVVADGYTQSGGELVLLEVLVDDLKIMDLDPDVSVASNQEIGMKLFPNPVSDNLSVISDTMIEAIEITDIFGNTVYTASNLSSDNMLWDLSDINGNKVASGTYFIRITDADGVKVNKIIVQ